MPSAETVAREDLILFLNACFSCSGQREFYSTAEEQRVSIQFLHQYILGNYRRLYTLTLAAGINDFNSAEIVFNLLASGKYTNPKDKDEENALLTQAFRLLPPQRAWKLASRLRAERINNRRTRALLHNYVTDNKNLTFHAVKYRRHLRSVARHARVPLSGELPEFLFGNFKNVFKTPLLEQFRRARYSAEAVYELPFTVAQGMAQRHKIPTHIFLKRIEPQLTEGERLRLQTKSKQAKTEIELRPEHLSLTALASYIVSLPIQQRQEREAELRGWLDVAAQAVLKHRGFLALPEGQIGLVLDNSYSASGSREKRLRPLAMALAGAWLIAQQGQHTKPFWTHFTHDPLFVQARGQSNLSERFLEALAWGASTIIIISDGVENDPPDAFNALYLAARRLMPKLKVLHFNPVFDAEMLSIRSLSGAISAVGLRDADDLPTALSFARFAAGEGPLRELEDFLAQRCATFLTRKPKGFEEVVP